MSAAADALSAGVARLSTEDEQSPGDGDGALASDASPSPATSACAPPVIPKLLPAGRGALVSGRAFHRDDYRTCTPIVGDFAPIFLCANGTDAVQTEEDTPETVLLKARRSGTRNM